MKELEDLSGERLAKEVNYYLDCIMDKQDSIGEELTFSYRQEFKEVKNKIIGYLDTDPELVKSLLSAVREKFLAVEVKISELKLAIESFRNTMKVVKSA